MCLKDLYCRIQIVEGEDEGGEGVSYKQHQQWSFGSVEYFVLGSVLSFNAHYYLCYESFILSSCSCVTLMQLAPALIF